MSGNERLTTGIEGLDSLLGGGLKSGALTVVVGATGIGKTQLALHFANAGRHSEGVRGILFDMSCLGDSQAHEAYCERLFGWPLRPFDPAVVNDIDRFLAADREHGEYVHIFDYRGPRPDPGRMDFDAQRAWQGELASKLNAAIAFLYGHFVRGVRRVVVDGIDPAERARDSIQFELFEYVYHQILRKDPEWVARDLFRQAFRRHAAEITARSYAPESIGCLLSCTSRETMLEQLIERRLDEGDWLANANTVILMGKVLRGGEISRALYIAKHRGSAAAEQIVPYRITDRGIELI